MTVSMITPPRAVWSISDSFVFGVNGLCTYCGDPSDCVDHVVPWSYLTSVRRRNSGRAPGVRTYACNECNGLLSAKNFPTFIERVRYVAMRLAMRYSRYSSVPEWDEDDLEGMGQNLRRVIEANDWVGRNARARVSWRHNPCFQEVWHDVRERVSDDQLPSYRQHIAEYFCTVPPVEW